MKRIICLLACFSYAHLFAQTPESLIEKVKKNYSNERIYIQYDKKAYLAGETIRFKAYMKEGSLPSAQSTSLTVQLLNDSGRIIQQKFLPVIQSCASGNFVLPSSMAQGNYMIRAFSRRMMNFGSDDFYSTRINIYSKVKKEETAYENDYRVYFLPEGGNMIGGLANRIAFKAIDKNNDGFDVSGMIKDAAGNEILPFASTHEGMGSFIFLPVAGEKYVAEFTTPSGGKKTAVLPEVTAEGNLLRLKRTPGKLSFEVNASAVFNNAFLPDYLLGVMDNTVIFKVPLDLKNKTFAGIIPENDLASGILQLTLFSKENLPLAERLCFINSGDYKVNGKLNADTTSLEFRAKNVFTYSWNDTLRGNFSVSVTDADRELDPNITDNIFSAFLLSGELKGKINNPAYYFESNDDAHKDNLDLVMMTNGWRHYSWRELFSNIMPSMAFKDENYISMSGVAFDGKDKPLTDTRLSFVMQGKDGSDFFMVKTDQSGNFELPGMIFADTAKFTLRNNSKDKFYSGVNMKPFSLANQFAASKPPAFQPWYKDLSAEKQSMVTEGSVLGKAGGDYGITLDVVKINLKAKTTAQIYEKKYSTGILGGGARTTLDILAEKPRAGINILEYLRTRLAGVNISGGPVSNYFLNYRNAIVVSRGGSGPPAKIPMNVFVDEVEVDADQAASYQADQIALVKLYPPNPVSGSGGALSIYTRRDAIVTPVGVNPASIFITEGYSASKEFFSPDYSVLQTVLKDERTTLFWDPYLAAGRSRHQFSFSFYNNDRSKKFRIILEGMLEDGRLIHEEKIIGQ